MIMPISAVMAMILSAQASARSVGTVCYSRDQYVSRASFALIGTATLLLL